MPKDVSEVRMPDEQYAVSELRKLRNKAEKSGAEIAKELRMWQSSLGHGKFKTAYSRAGWTSVRVEHYLAYYQEDAPVDSRTETTDSKETTRSEIQGLIYRVQGIKGAIEQVLAEDKWQRDRDFAELRQAGKALAALLEKL